jgi:putative membrane-bound dehydrogenase-like protein
MRKRGVNRRMEPGGRGPSMGACGTILCLVACALSVCGVVCRAAEDEHPPAKAVAALDVAPGLEATLFASEPMIASPTNVDVDARGRVWVCDVVNYRHRNGSRPAGDRIMILEDTDGDGKADKSTVFYQGRDIDSAMGICVLGNQVIVSVSPNIFVFTDIDGDGKADKKELLFTKTGTPQHDHSAHKFVFGPDGRLYWNMGNAGKSVHDKYGNLVIDNFGRPVIDDRLYHGGMAFRCNRNGGQFEVLANNFRNNYELAVDSFGGVWQSDNDDDGNRSVRINYILEYGNYGYRDQMTGASWQEPRTNLEAEIPDRHWHQNDPGVVPNLLITGAGAPSGICVYEGDLLPAVFHNQLIHCDPGVNVVRAYPVKKSGAGYQAGIVDILRGSRDNWFRPSDIAVAPDGSLMVADWYDPGVGGHHMGDIVRGRIFRVAPPKTPYRVPHYDIATAAGAVRALESPNLATRYLAWKGLEAKKTQAEPELKRLLEKTANPRIRARALWLLGSVSSKRQEFIDQAALDPDPDLRTTALRVSRHVGVGLTQTLKRLVHDPSPEVRRECAIALRNLPIAERPSLWVDLALQYDAHDRWYLEALGIGADESWEACLSAWLAKGGTIRNAAGRDIVWRSRSPEKTPTLLAEIIADPHTPSSDLPRYFRAFDFQSEKDRALAHLAFDDVRQDEPTRQIVMAEAIQRLDLREVLNNPAHAAALKRTVAGARGTRRYLDLIERFDLRGYAAELLALAQANPEDETGVRAVEILFAQDQKGLFARALAAADPQIVENTLRVLGSAQDPRANGLVAALADDRSRPIDLRRQAVRALGRTKSGATRILTRAEKGKLDEGLRMAASAALYASPVEEIRTRAARLFPLPPAVDAKPLPSIKQLAKRTGDAQRGRIIFATTGTCAKCHVINGEGKDVGPNLSEIGAKLSRPALYESILFPSAGINHNFAAYTLVLTNGNVVSGILINRTADSIAIKGIDAITHTYAVSLVEEIKEQPVSLMPADLQKAVTAEDLVNVVEYLTTLKGKTAPIGRPATRNTLAQP